MDPPILKYINIFHCKLIQPKKMLCKQQYERVEFTVAVVKRQGGIDRQTLEECLLHHQEARVRDEPAEIFRFVILSEASAIQDAERHPPSLNSSSLA